MDANTDLASAAHTKSTTAAKQTFSSGHAGYVAGDRVLYTPHIYSHGRVDRIDSFAPGLFCLFGNYSFIVSAVGHIG